MTCPVKNFWSYHPTRLLSVEPSFFCPHILNSNSPLTIKITYVFNTSDSALPIWGFIINIKVYSKELTQHAWVLKPCTFQRKDWPPTTSWERASEPWNMLPDKSVFEFLRTRVIADSSKPKYAILVDNTWHVLSHIIPERIKWCLCNSSGSSQLEACACWFSPGLYCMLVFSLLVLISILSL